MTCNLCKRGCRGDRAYVGEVLAWELCLRWWRASMGEMPAQVTDQRGLREWHARVTCPHDIVPAWEMGSVLKKVAWVSCKSEQCCQNWRKYQNSVLDRIVGGALFLELFPKPRRKLIVQIQKKKSGLGHVHSKHIFFFRVSFGYLNLKLF